MTTGTLYLEASEHVKVDSTRNKKQRKAVDQMPNSTLITSQTEDWLPAADRHVTQLEQVELLEAYSADPPVRPLVCRGNIGHILEDVGSGRSLKSMITYHQKLLNHISD